MEKPSQKSDKELIDAYFDGDSGAFDALVDRYFRAVYNFVYRYVRSDSEIEDILQETFVKAWRKLEHFDTDKPFKPWIFQIAKTTTIDWLRKRKNRSLQDIDGQNATSLADTLPDDSELQHELFDKAQDIRTVARLISELGEEQNALIYLKIHEELTFEEIAAILDKPLNTVKSAYRRILIDLKRKMEGKN